MAKKDRSIPTPDDVMSVDVDEFQRKIRQARQLGLTLSLAHDALDGMDPGDLTVVLSVLSDLLEEIEKMLGPVADSVVQFQRQLVRSEAAHG